MTLEKIAIQASKGPWTHRKHPNNPNLGFVQGHTAEGMAYALEVLGEDYTGYGDEEQRQKDMLFVATFNPLKVLEPLKELETLRGTLA